MQTLININILRHKHNPSVNNTAFIFIYNDIYVRATRFDLVGNPQALQENRSKSCLVFLRCWIPNAYKFLLQGHKVYKKIYTKKKILHQVGLFTRCLKII